MDRRQVEALYPLSPQQQGMLLESAAGGAHHVEQLSAGLHGDLDVDAFRAAWERLVRRHPMLRTAFVWKGQREPLQAVLRSVELPWRYEDLRHLEPGVRRKTVQSHLDTDRRRGFELSRAPLMRISLLRTADRAHRMVWTHHHILMDGWCRAQLLEEHLSAFAALAGAETRDRFETSEPATPYRRYVAWLRDRDGGGDEAYWRLTLAGLDRPSPLAARREPDPAVEQAEVAVPTPGEIRGALPAEATAALLSTARRLGLTANTLVQAAWSLVLHRFGGDETPTFGVTLSGRPEELPGLERTVGLFVSTLPLRLEVDPGRTVSAWLADVQRRNVELRRHGWVTAGQVHGWSGLPARHPLFESLVVYENYPVGDLPPRVAGVEVGEVRTAGASTRTPVVLLVEPGEELAVTLVHDRRRLTTADAEGFLRPFLDLLGEMPRRIDGSVGRLLAGLPDAASGPRLLAAPAPVRRPVTVATGGPVEDMVRTVWCRVLGVDTVERHEPFFATGGHSLLAVRLVGQLSRTFGVELPLGLLFEAPTVAGLAERIERLLPEAGGTPPPLLEPAAAAPAGEELSFAQERLWFLDRMEPGNPFYVNTSSLRLRGKLAPAALAGAIEEVVRRHRVLRTVFPEVEGEPRARPRAGGPAPLRTVDLSGLDPAGRQRQVDRLRREEAGRPCDLATGPLVRFRLLRLGSADGGGDEHLLIYACHHIVSDAWSNDVLRRELSSLYAAYAAGEPSSLAELPVQYGDFARWQRRWLSGEVLDAKLDAWRRLLGDGWPTLDLPADRPRPAVPSYRGARASFPVAQGPGSALEDAGEGSTTPFMAFLAAFYVALHQLTGQSDLLVGTAVAGRTAPRVEGLIGCFVNMLPLRCDVSGNPRFGDLLRRVRGRVLEALAHQDLPLDRLVAELQPQRQRDGAPLFRVAFGVQNAPAGEASVAGLEIEPVPPASEYVRFDLTVWMEPRSDGYTAHWTYASDLFDATTIARFHDVWQRVLAAAASDPEQRVDAFAGSAADPSRDIAQDSWRRRQGRRLVGARRSAVAATPSETRNPPPTPQGADDR